MLCRDWDRTEEQERKLLTCVNVMVVVHVMGAADRLEALARRDEEI